MGCGGWCEYYLGIPIIRVSVDHGTGFDQAGKGTSDALSLLNSIEYAILFARNRNKQGKKMVKLLMIADDLPVALDTGVQVC